MVRWIWGVHFVFPSWNFVKSGTGRNQGVGGHCKGEWKGEWWRMTSLEQDEVSRVWRHGPRNLDVASSLAVSVISNQLVTIASKLRSLWRTMRVPWRLQLSFKTGNNVLAGLRTRNSYESQDMIIHCPVYINSVKFTFYVFLIIWNSLNVTVEQAAIGFHSREILFLTLSLQKGHQEVGCFWSYCVFLGFFWHGISHDIILQFM